MRNTEFPAGIANHSLLRFRGVSGLVLVLTLVVLEGFAHEIQAAQSEFESSRLVSGRQLSSALQERRSLNVSGQTLRATLQRIHQNTRIAICVDRRIDPALVVDVATEYVTTRQILIAVVASNPEAAASFGEHAVYLGPKPAADRLRTLSALREQDVQQLRRKMDSVTYRKIVQLHERTWPDLAQPQQLLTGAAAAAGLKITNADRVPHDLWKGTPLPKMTFCDFATLVLNQFDLTFTVSAEGNVTLVTVPDTVVIEQQHRVSSKRKAGVARRWNAAFPDLEVTWKGSTAEVATTVERHEQLRALADGEPLEAVAAAPLNERLFSMKVERTTYGSVIEEFRRQGIVIQIEGIAEPDLSTLLHQPAAFELTDSRGDEFFAKVFSGMGAEVVLTNGKVSLNFQ